MSEPVEATKPKTLVQKLADIVAEIDNVDKRGRNEFQKYAYVKAADVAWLVRKALSSRNVYLNSDVVEVRNYEIPAREGVMQAVDVKMKLTFIDGDAPGEPIITSHAYGTGTDKGDKAIYKAMTGALKYGLRHAFLIPDESDPEADVETDKATANAKAVGEAKVAELKKKAGKQAGNGQEQELPSGAVACIFYTEPPSQNGHFVEFLNLREFVSQKKELEETILLLFSNSKGKKTKDGTTLVPSENVPSLLEKLAGDYGLSVKRLEAPHA